MSSKNNSAQSARILFCKEDTKVLKTELPLGDYYFPVKKVACLLSQPLVFIGITPLCQVSNISIFCTNNLSTKTFNPYYKTTN
ncbi:MAG: hypothetical protein ACI81W_001161 [Saprospiraceae bacterium]